VVCLAVMTDPFAPQVLSIKADKYQTLSLQVSNVVVLEKAIAYISFVTLHSTITKQQCYCLVSIAPVQWHETIHVFEHSKLKLCPMHVFLDFLLWQCRL